ncbi:hypothetical protein Tsubulata_043705 [Turnera subulata]|uniref:Uncharacterized protein n=1 Tax=Turnera subulata TaxID=218843 RepID=A0A9Q0J901_9ROSI|nr:hypothetical protein Tsubulata_043705 [Turnera subulata]
MHFLCHQTKQSFISSVLAVLNNISHFVDFAAINFRVFDFCFSVICQVYVDRDDDEICRQKRLYRATVAVTMTSHLPPETVERSAVTMTEREKSDSRARRLIFTKFGLTPVASTTSPPPPPQLPPKRLVSPPSTLPRLAKSTSSRTQQLTASIEMNNRTPTDRKQCHCKQSRCLKFCDDCHNNVDNEAARRKAAESILERNPNAFKPKIVRAPSNSDVDGELRLHL